MARVLVVQPHKASIVVTSKMQKQNHLAERGVDLTVLFITYNRADLLEISFRSIQERMDFDDLQVEYVVADDASEQEHLTLVKSLRFDKHLLSKSNMGLGANANKGILGSNGHYILQIQDDCEFVGDRKLALIAMHILQEDSEVGIVQLTHQTPDVPYEMRCLENRVQYRVYENDEIARRRDCGMRPYSDQPHLKRREFVDDIGLYSESVSMVEMELEYQQRVACQKKWRVASIELAPGFKHLGAMRSFNPSNVRERRLKVLESYPIVGLAFRILRPTMRKIRNWIRSSCF